MRVIRTASEMREVRRGISGSVALVATLGGIHAGHTAHMYTVRPPCHVVVGPPVLHPTVPPKWMALADRVAIQAAETANLDAIFAELVKEAEHVN